MQDISISKNHLRAYLSRFIRKNKSGFRLSSGAVSQTYFDIKSAVGDSQTLYEICRQVSKIIIKRPQIGAVGGIETGSIPIASAFNVYYNLLMNQDISFFYVRKGIREYGTKKMIEGKPEINNALIEDVIFEGNNITKAIEIMEINNLNVNVIIPIIFRGSDKDRDELSDKLHTRIEPVFFESEFTL